jgi:hypothetical protein
MSRMIAALIATLLACGFANPTRANECDEVIGRHMAGQAMLAAQFVASAEKVGMTAQQINAVLTDIAANSAIEEFLDHGWSRSRLSYKHRRGLYVQPRSCEATASVGLLGAD